MSVTIEIKPAVEIGLGKDGGNLVYAWILMESPDLEKYAEGEPERLKLHQEMTAKKYLLASALTVEGFDVVFHRKASKLEPGECRYILQVHDIEGRKDALRDEVERFKAAFADFEFEPYSSSSED